MNAKIEQCSCRIYSTGEGGGVRTVCSLPGYEGLILVSKDGEIYGWTPESNKDVYKELQTDWHVPENIQKMLSNLEIHVKMLFCFCQNFALCLVEKKK